MGDLSRERTYAEAADLAACSAQKMVLLLYATVILYPMYVILRGGKLRIGGLIPTVTRNTN